MDSTPQQGDNARSAARPALRFIARGWWFILLGIVVGAAAGYAQAASKPVVYQATAVVVAPSTGLSTDTFDNVARVVFQTDAVLGGVVGKLGMQTTPRSLLTEHKLAIEPVSGAVAVRILGRASDPVAARQLANAAAQSFLIVGNKHGLGTLHGFLTNHNGVAEAAPVRRDAAVSGVAGGLLAGAILLLIFAIRRPTLDEEQARQALRAQTAFTAHTKRTQAGSDGRRSKEAAKGGSSNDGSNSGVSATDATGELAIFPEGLLAAVERAVTGGNAPPGAQTAVVLISGSRRRGHAATVVAEELAAQLSGSPGEGAQARRPIVADGEDPIGRPLEEATSVVVVVPEGARGQSLARVEEELRVAPNLDRRAVLLVD
jgi:capsular polysaccharide biosynthesis protein